MQIWSSKYVEIISCVILNVKIFVQTFCIKLMETSKSLFNTTQRNQDYMHEIV